MKINYYVEGKILIWSVYPPVTAINQAIQGAVFFNVSSTAGQGRSLFLRVGNRWLCFLEGLAELHCERS